MCRTSLNPTNTMTRLNASKSLNADMEPYYGSLTQDGVWGKSFISWVVIIGTIS